MKHGAPEIYTFERLKKETNSGVSREIEPGRWAPARSMGFFGFKYIGCRLHAAWLVFTGKADVIVWPEDEHYLWSGKVMPSGPPPPVSKKSWQSELEYYSKSRHL